MVYVNIFKFKTKSYINSVRISIIDNQFFSVLTDEMYECTISPTLNVSAC